MKSKKAKLLLAVVATLLLLTSPVMANEPIKDTGNPLERAVSGVANFPNRVLESVWDAVGFKSLNELVFSHGLVDEEKEALPWQPKTIPYINDFYKSLCFIVTPLYAFVILFTSLKFLKGAANPIERKEAQGSISRWFIAIIIMALAPFLIDVMMSVSLILTDAIQGAFTSVIATKTIDDLDILDIGILNSNLSTGSFLGTVLVKVMFSLLFVYFNVLYIVRMVAITVMYIFTPIMAIMWAINKNVTAVSIWIGELASNAFMPVAHALVLCVVLLLCDVKDVMNGSWATILIMMYTLVPLGEALRNSMQSIFNRAAGFAEDRTAGKAIAGFMGFGSALSLARVGKSTMGAGTSSKFSAASGFASGITGDRQVKNPQPTKNGTKTTAPQRAPINTSGSTGAISAGEARFTAPSGPKQYTLPKTGAKAKVYNMPPKPVKTYEAGLNKAVKAGQIASGIVNLAAIPAKMLAGAVPGGEGIVNGATNITKQGVAGITTATVAGHQFAQNYAGTKNISAALERTTGTTDGKQAAARIAGASMRVGSQPKQTSSAAQQFTYDVKSERILPHRLLNTTSKTGKYKVAAHVQQRKKPVKQSVKKQASSNKRKGEGWRTKPITRKQAYTLGNLRIEGNPKNRGEASDLIGKRLNNYSDIL